LEIKLSRFNHICKTVGKMLKKKTKDTQISLDETIAIPASAYSSEM
jgi:hypothetical protein